MQNLKLNSKDLIRKSKELRLDIINMANKYKDGHVASGLSIIDIMATLYYKVMKIEDQFILSKGHGCLALYSILKKKGFNPKYCGHPDIEVEEGLMCTSGSLGHGLPIGVGKALAKKIKNEPGIIYVIIGDGECQEGTIWESFNLINRYHLTNIVTLIDHNKLQALDTVDNIMNESNLKNKIKAFGLSVSEVNGHKFEDLFNAFKPQSISSHPLAIICNTVKGKGISFMEGDSKWQSRIMDEKELKKAKEELSIKNTNVFL